MFKITESFKGVLSFGRETFSAGKEIPEAIAEKMDTKSLLADGVIVSVSDSSEDSLSSKTKDELFTIADGLGLEMLKKSTKDELIKAIEAEQAE